MSRMMGSNKRFDLVIQDEYLIIVQSQHHQCLLLPRTIPPNDATLGLSVEDIADFQHLHGRRMGFDAIYGVFSLLRGTYLALITNSKVVAQSVDQHEIRIVTKLELMLIPTQQLPVLTPSQEEEEARYISMLTDNIISQRLHFSFEHDLTHTQQRIASLDPLMSIADRADRRFCWNYPVATAFLDNNLYDWITPVMQAYIEVTEEIHAASSVFKLVYISRRSCRRQGHRFTMRGIDDDGNVANFVETEQIACFNNGRVTSFVQIRGSIPLYWSSPVTMKYAPTVYLRQNHALDVAAFTKHAYELMTLYNRVVLVNLIDKKKEQLKLGEAFATTVTDAATADSHILANCRLVWFDFHHECRKMKYENLQKLLQQVDDDFVDYGFFHKLSDGTVISTQSGLVRTNCMDNLDRTNVVQSLFARRSLLLQLQAAANETTTIQMGSSVLTSPYPELEIVFKRVWGNNADAISLLYAGTGALKTDFTRTGKRTKHGALMDGYNSCLRYLINNFKDGQRQDVLDLLLGKHVVTRKSGMRASNAPMESIVFKVVGMVLMFFILELWRHSGASNTQMSFVLDRLVRAVIWTMFTGILMLIIVIKKGSTIGKQLARLPSFRPQDGCMVSWK